MQRSRLRKLKKEGVRACPRPGALLRHASIAAAVMASLPRLYAAEAAEENGGLEEIVVTAQKRTENLQEVPISITALGTEKLEELNVTKFEDYVQYLPSVSFQTSGPGFARVFMRGVSSGDVGNHSGPLPSVGVYLDEQPITTIQGALDVHVYDIERVEALAGPQGTLYGASSEAGTVRIITNKPETGKFKAGYNLEANTLRGQGGYIAEGFVNMPIGDHVAVRLVGYGEHDGGYIDNLPGTLTYAQYPMEGFTWPNEVCLANTGPAPAGCKLTPAHARNRFNAVDTYGGRAALKVDLGDRWTITPQVLYQHAEADGTFFADPALGKDLTATRRFYPDNSVDEWWQAALTVQGKIGNLDVTYAAGYLARHDHTQSDYTDYTLAYARQTYYISYVEYSVLKNLPPGTASIDPSQWIDGRDRYRKLSNELRIATPADKRVRFIGGLFTNWQKHHILQDYLIDELPEYNSVTGWPHTLWLTNQNRVDRDYAVFGELSFDFTRQLTGSVGYRFFRYDNSLKGFFGFGLNNPLGSSTGENATVENRGVACVQPGILGNPCTDLDASVAKNGSTPKFNLTYKFDDDHMVYVTVSKGYRPGGINRRQQAPPNPPLATYEPDYLKNYEIGFKTTWFGNRLRFNGAFFREDWKSFQFGFLGQNSFTIIRNAAAARITGAEQELEWAPVNGLTFTLAATELDPKMSEDFCLSVDTNGVPLPLTAPNPDDACKAYDAVPKGTQLPNTPKFKGNVLVRYEFPLAGLDAHVQAGYVYTSSIKAELSPFDNDLVGTQPAYGLASLLGGVRKGNLDLELFVDNVFDKRGQTTRAVPCTIQMAGMSICGDKPMVAITAPRTIGLRIGQRF
jgi:outer membrane receptor protein involved in Fe transport